MPYDENLHELPVATALTDYHFAVLNASDQFEQCPAELMRRHAITPPVAIKTADYTILTTDVGSIFTNEGATGTVVLNLPAATVTQRYRGIVRAAFAFRFNPQDGEVITHTTAGSADGGAGKYTGSSTLGADIELVCVTAGRWEAKANKGTWTLEA